MASEPAADLSLVTLDHVPPGALVAPMANSDSVKIGDQVVVIGAVRAEALDDRGLDQRPVGSQYGI